MKRRCRRRRSTDGCFYRLRTLSPTTRKIERWGGREAVSLAANALLNKTMRHMESPTRHQGASKKKKLISFTLTLPPSFFPSSYCLKVMSLAFWNIFNVLCLFVVVVCRSVVAFICIFFSCFILFYFFACLLPNEALRIKCLKDCRHFTWVVWLFKDTPQYTASWNAAQPTVRRVRSILRQTEEKKEEALILLCYVSGIRASYIVECLCSLCHKDQTWRKWL